jgi:hypothetical protein
MPPKEARASFVYSAYSSGRASWGRLFRLAFTTDDRREARHKLGELRRRGELHTRGERRSRHRQRIRTLRRDHKPNESPTGIAQDLHSRQFALVSSSVAMALPSGWREHSI